MQQQAGRLRGLLSQLRHRHVIRVGLAYLVVGYLVIEGADVLAPALDLPDWTVRLVTALVILGFPVSLALAWAFDVTPAGVVRTPPEPEEPGEGGPRRPDDPSAGDTDLTESLRLPRGPVIAVLPFTNLSGEAGDEFFTDGITEDIITGLSRFTYLFVIARHTTFKYKDRSVDVRELGRDLGAGYVLEGGIRKAAEQLRVSVRLLDAPTGTQLWAETYDRDLTAGAVFAVQDEITSRVVASVADPDGVLARSAAPSARAKPTESLDAYEAVLRTFSYWQRQTPAEHAEVRNALERAVRIDSRYAHAWACLSIVYLDEVRVGFNPQPDAHTRILGAARRAVELGPSEALAYLALAQAHFFRGDLDAFFPAAARTVQLNPNDSTNLATTGMLTAYAGEWERGLAMLKKAMALNPHHPGWYHLPVAFWRYREGDYAGALRAALDVEMPGYFPSSMVLAAVYGQLGRKAEARAAADQLLTLNPRFAEHAHEVIALWQHDPALRAELLVGLRKAGLPVGGPE